MSPYLGFGSLTPALDVALAEGRGLFVLALTSNPEGRQVQHARDDEQKTVAQSIIDQVGAVNAGDDPIGSIGLVIGATIGRTGVDLSAVNGPLLAPGLGAQGASAADLKLVFADAHGALLPTTSREVLGAGPSVAGLREAAARGRRRSARSAGLICAGVAGRNALNGSPSPLLWGAGARRSALAPVVSSGVSRGDRVLVHAWSVDNARGARARALRVPRHQLWDTSRPAMYPNVMAGPMLIPPDG